MRSINLETYLDKKAPDAKVVHNGKIFLGGTCGDSQWREAIIPLIQMECFNPVVENWTMETQQIEEEIKKAAAVNLYVITPKQSGFYSFSELTTAAIKEPKRTVIAFLDSDDGVEWTDKQKDSIEAIKSLLKQEAGVEVQGSLKAAADAVNDKLEELGIISEEHVESIRNRD